MAQHIWGEGPKIFASHATSTSSLAGEVKALSADLGISAFVDHEDIKVAEQWQDVILKALSTMDVFLAILSSDFKKSFFCNQELGFAIAERRRRRYSERPLIIMAVMCDDTDPYGFLLGEQAAKVRQAADIPSKVLDTLFEQDFYLWFESFIYRIRRSPSYRNSIQVLVPELERIWWLTSKQAQALVDAVNWNDQVYGSRVFMSAIDGKTVKGPYAGADQGTDQISFYHEPTSPYTRNRIQFRIDRGDGYEDSAPW